MPRKFVAASSHYLTAPDSTTLRSPTTAITLGAFVQLRSSGSGVNAGIVAKSLKTSAWAAPFYAYGFRMGGDQTTIEFMVHAGTETVVTGRSGSGLPAETWLLVVGTWETGQPLRLRVWRVGDGVKVVDSSGSPVSMTIGYGTGGPLQVGADEDRTQFLNGDVGYVGVHNAVLSDLQLEYWRYYAQPPITMSGGYWAINGTSDPEVDSHQANPLDAVNFSGASLPPDYPAIYPPPPPPSDTPGAPTLLGVDPAASVTSAVVRVQAPSSDGGSPIRGYVVTARPVGS